MPDHYDVTNEYGGKIGEIRPRIDYSSGIATFLTGLIMFAVIGVFILFFRLLFKFPKVMIPVTIVVVFIVIMSASTSPTPRVTMAANAGPVSTQVAGVSVARASATPVSTVTPVPTRAAPTPSPTPEVLWVIVGNTGGDGVYVRRSPKMTDKIVAWPDGTKLKVVGPDIDGDGHHWKNVLDPNGNNGWVPSEYVSPSKP